MIPFDTSSWIQMLRPDGDPAVRERVTALRRAAPMDTTIPRSAGMRARSPVKEEFGAKMGPIAPEDVWSLGDRNGLGPAQAHRQA